MRQVNPTVYRFRWLLWVPWVVAMAYVLEWVYIPLDYNSLRVWTPYGLHRIIAFALDSRALAPSGKGMRGFMGYDFHDYYFSPGEVKYLLVSWVYAIVCAICLAMFVGVGQSSTRQFPARRGLSAPSVLAAGTMAGLLLTAVAFMVLDVLNMWTTVGSMRGPAPSLPLGSTLLEIPQYGVTLAISITDVAIATILIALFAKREQRFWRCETITQLLLAAAICLIALGHGLHALDLGRGRLSNPGDQGVTTSLIFAYTVLLWAWPARVILLFRLRQYEQAARDTHDCYACGYDLRGSLAAGRDACPECGAAIPAEQLAAQSNV